MFNYRGQRHLSDYENELRPITAAEKLIDTGIHYHQVIHSQNKYVSQLYSIISPECPSPVQRS